MKNTPVLFFASLKVRFFVQFAREVIDFDNYICEGGILTGYFLFATIFLQAADDARVSSQLVICAECFPKVFGAKRWETYGR